MRNLGIFLQLHGGDKNRKDCQGNKGWDFHNTIWMNKK